MSEGTSHLQMTQRTRVSGNALEECICDLLPLVIAPHQLLIVRV